MRPKESTRGGKKGGKKGGKSSSASSSVRSKVTEVKRSVAVARMRNESGREEIRDLVTPVKMTPSGRRKKTLAKTVSGKLQKVKSAVGLSNRHARMEEVPSSARKESPAKVLLLNNTIVFLVFSCTGTTRENFTYRKRYFFLLQVKRLQKLNSHQKLKNSPSAASPRRSSRRQ